MSERNTIVVTGVRDKGQASGTKTDTPLIETPQTITVIDGEELARRNARSINQALNYVAGVSANQRGGMVTRYDQIPRANARISARCSRSRPPSTPA